MFTARRDLYENAPSDVTSQTYWVGDGIEQTLQVTNSASTTTVQASNADGRGEVIPETAWSTITTNVGGGMMNIKSGHRWMRCLQDVDSGTRVALLEIQNRVR